ncbi:hypothetical protein [Amphiplicatus metriothermophilus]|uniref:Uncharacterized protein n=1 Tax=Amphiplicatus metriothermophilus TaxID=1519374 RepID=A0A239PTF2_9PROT|nr:hypothetical protein [Amphiplicatus metriothermophilus]MBB5519413.1 hypothetical protein [Amphiplicatus metriothermophilus]SNT73571.1 hypothetical protein SAMN06297382_1882 [Amphiplicatus metriothermophilus]
MQRSPGARPAVHELQARLEAEARRARPRRRPRSRAAQLHLIDLLSRWGGAGLALIAGVGIFIAVTAGGAYPFRAFVWAAILLGALYACRRLLADFRAGSASAARPFLWRANYTAALSALGAGFGAGAVIVLPAGAPDALAMQTLALILVGALGAAMLHAPHDKSAAALWAPAALFCFVGAWRVGGPALAFFGAAAAFLAGAVALFLLNRHLGGQAQRRFPRTSLARRNLDAEEAPEQDAPHGAGAAAV